MKQKLLNLIFICLFFFSYGQENLASIPPITNEVVSNGKIENNVFICHLFQWEIAIPKGFRISDSSRIEEIDKKGHDFIQKQISNTTNIISEPKNLISFEKNKYNYFSSSYEALKGNKKVTLEEHKKFSLQLLNNTYSKAKELKFDIQAYDVKLGKQQFYKVLIRLYNAKNDRLLLTQEIYNTFINHHLFSASINYTNEVNGMLLNYSLKKSFESNKI